MLSTKALVSSDGLAFASNKIGLRKCGSFFQKALSVRNHLDLRPLMLREDREHA